MKTGIQRLAAGAGILLGSMSMATPALADDPSTMPPGYVGGGDSYVVPPAPPAPTPPAGHTCTVPHPTQVCDTPDMPYVPPAAPAPVHQAPAPVYAAPAPAAPALQPYVAPAAPAAPAAYAPEYVAPVQAPPPVIQNRVPVEGEASLTLTPVEEPAVDAVASDDQASNEAISSSPSSSATPSPSSSPKSGVVIQASSAANDAGGFSAVPILIFAGLGLVGLGGFAGYQKMRSKPL